MAYNSLVKSLWDKFARLPLSAAGDRPRVGAATEVPAPPVPKVPKSGTTFPGYFKSTKVDNTVIRRRDLRTANTDLTTLRNNADTWKVVRDFSLTHPDLAAANDAYVRLAVTRSYTAVAKNRDGTFNADATSLLQQLLTKFDVLQDYSDGFSGVLSIRSVAESLAKELRMYGACSLELVLDKGRLPRTLAPVSVPSLRFYPDKSGKWTRPVQVVGSEEVDLDIPTFFYVSLDQDLGEAYSTSPIEPALQPILFAQQFLNDLRRVVQRAIHPRMLVSLTEDSIKKSLPPEYVGDSQRMREFIDLVISDVASRVNGLAPEDAMVLLDSMTAEYMTGGNTSLEAEYRALNDIINAKVATGAKVLPSILGHGSGTQNIASTETMLFLKNAEGAVQFKLNEIFSKALTLAVRLFGMDVYVEFAFDSIELRPDTELEAFRAQRQSRLLELLSLGIITDEEASLQLTGRLPPAGYTKLAGTGFRSNTPAAANPYSNTSQGGAGGGAMNQNLKSDAPSKKRGGNGT